MLEVGVSDRLSLALGPWQIRREWMETFRLKRRAEKAAERKVIGGFW